MIDVIAFYLPQFHPIPENDKWWGEGFTEWTNVARANKLFKGHYQPRIPADLGFYDLRIPEVREKQVMLAKEAGVTAFCYWHYWFGNGKQLLEKPLQEVVSQGKPDFPFMLGWANHSWHTKNWNVVQSSYISTTLIEQSYPGKQDIINHFNTMLPVFKDKRYYKINGKLAFLIYQVENIPDFLLFKQIWNHLAKEQGLPEFFFIGYSEEDNKLSKSAYVNMDANCLCRLNVRNLSTNNSFFKRLYRYTKSHVFHVPANVVEYTDVITSNDSQLYDNEKIYPAVIPNWDPSPRRGLNSLIYNNSTPDLFYKHVKRILLRIQKKEEKNRIIFLKSWNEWAEGNYMEPDLKWRKGYIQALRRALDEFNNE